jgi:hypothetical protein
VGNLFEAHKYAFTIPMHTIRALKRRVAELEAMLDATNLREPCEACRYAPYAISGNNYSRLDCVEGHHA